MTTYLLCKKVIENGAYSSRDDMLIKLDVFLLAGRLTTDEYNKLVSLLDAQ